MCSFRDTREVEIWVQTGIAESKEIQRHESFSSNTTVIALFHTQQCIWALRRWKKGRSNEKEEDGDKKQLKGHGEQLHPSELLLVKQLAGWWLRDQQF